MEIDSFSKRCVFLRLLATCSSVQKKKVVKLIELNSNDVSLFETSQRILLTKGEFAEN